MKAKKKASRVAAPKPVTQVDAWRRVAQFRSSLEQTRASILAQVAAIDAVLAVPIEEQVAKRASGR